MKNNATPRPWVIRPSRDTSGDVGITAEGLPNVIAETFADIRFRGERNAAEAKANAELIVTAVNAYDGLVEALEACAKRFREYEQSHLAKGTHDGRMKADRNADMAEVCEAALKIAKGET